MKFHPNGFVIQNKDLPLKSIQLKNIKNYSGIIAFLDSPLLTYRNDPKYTALQDEAMFGVTDDGDLKELSFISNSNLLKRYLDKCIELNIPLRILFAESDYSDEIWNEPLPPMKFIGYEYLECPFDIFLISVFDYYEYFQKHWKKLNEYGLFQTLEDVLAFKEDFDKALGNEVPCEEDDKDMKTYIFRISEVNLDQLLTFFRH